MVAKLRLAEIADIEGAALAEYKRDPKLAISKPQLLKHLKQSVGILEPDEKEAPVINIGQLKLMQQMIAKDVGCSIDGEYTETKLNEGE